MKDAVAYSMIGLLLFVGVFGAIGPANATHTNPAPSCQTHAKWSFCFQLDDARGQGLELNGVTYDGTLIFNRAGVPFSMTKYTSGAYGPFKDIMGTASGTVPGYGLGALTLTSAQCPRFFLGQPSANPAAPVLDPLFPPQGTLDASHRVGVEKRGGNQPAIAVWSKFNIYNYRFVQGYIMYENGDFEPRTYMGGQLIDSGSCTSGGSTCQSHFHYLYWRFDMDLGGAANDKFQEFKFASQGVTNQHNDLLCPQATQSWCRFDTEESRVRNHAQHMKWRAIDFTQTNSLGHPKSVELLSASNGPADTFSTKDVWALRFKCDSVSLACEMGYQVPTNPTSDAPITAYDNDESINAQDNVIWYAEKVYHEPRDEERTSMVFHQAGPVFHLRNLVGSNPSEPTYP